MDKRCVGFVAALVASALAADQRATALTTLELRPATQTVYAGQPVEIELYIVADPTVPVGVIDAVLQWDASRLTLTGSHAVGAYPWATTGFPGVPLNSSFTDGDAVFSVNVTPCVAATATPSGLLVATLKFMATSTLGTGQAQVVPFLGNSQTRALTNLPILGCGGQELAVNVGTPVSVTSQACLSALHCNDGTACTADACAGGVCTHNPAYDANAYCCDPGSGGLTSISDGNDCTTDMCNSSNGTVTHTNKVFGSPCGSQTQNACTNPDTCDANAVCLPNHVSNGAACDDNDTCSQSSSCQNGVCTGANPLPNGTACADGLDCTSGSGTCTGGKCVESTAVCGGTTPYCIEDPVCTVDAECGVQGPCTAGRCAAGYVCWGCLPAPKSCQTQADCPVGRPCENGFCRNCAANSGCVTVSCSPFTHQCVAAVHHEQCQDDVFCNGDEVCNQFGFCQPANPPQANCPSGLVCNEFDDTCVECVSDTNCPGGMYCNTTTYECVECLSNAHCNDGNPCNGIETCNQQAGTCNDGTPITCSQPNVCTIDVCNPGSGQCEPRPAETVPCSQQSPCPSGFICSPTNFCSPAQSCSDGDGCTLSDTCINGVCIGQAAGTNGTVRMQLAATSGSPYSVGQAIDVRLTLNMVSGSQSINTAAATLVWDELKLGPQSPFTVDPCTNHFSDPLNCNPGGNPKQYDWFASGLLASYDPDDLNASLLDGDAHYTATIGPGMPDAPVSSSLPLWVTTVKFVAARGTTAAGTNVSLVRCIGPNGTFSNVTAGAGTDVTGTLFSANVKIRCTGAAQCNDNNVCTTDTCNATTQFCEYANVADGTACGNQTPIGECDLPDVCQAGVCYSNPTTCPDDGNLCTDDVCNAATGTCSHPAKPNGTTCDDGLFCTVNETCTSGVCGGGVPRSCGDAFPCTADSCDETANQCSHVPDDRYCDDFQYCNGVEVCSVSQGCVPGTPPNCSSDGIACTINDFCNEAFNICDGVPDSSRCPKGEICVAQLGCIATSCQPPLIDSPGPRYLSIKPQPPDSTTPVALLVESDLWTCLSKYVGTPTPVDIDGNGSIDGSVATLVDDPADAAVLTPAQWGLTVFVTGEDIVPTDVNTGTPPLLETTYRVAADCGGGLFSPDLSLLMRLWADADASGLVNITDVQLSVLAFQGSYHLPLGAPNGGTTRLSVNLSGLPACNTAGLPTVNFTDIFDHIKAFQRVSYRTKLLSLPPEDMCALPCP
ncbi:MAG: hypothetical protein HY763_01205 [Planctomycetes bacterium]|nr:hypothetical protein [Planctomycetota bacterium]